MEQYRRRVEEFCKNLGALRKDLTFYTEKQRVFNQLAKLKIDNGSVSGKFHHPNSHL